MKQTRSAQSNCEQLYTSIMFILFYLDTSYRTKKTYLFTEILGDSLYYIVHLYTNCNIVFTTILSDLFNYIVYFIHQMQDMKCSYQAQLAVCTHTCDLLCALATLSASSVSKKVEYCPVSFRTGSKLRCQSNPQNVCN